MIIKYVSPSVEVFHMHLVEVVEFGIMFAHVSRDFRIKVFVLMCSSISEFVVVANLVIEVCVVRQVKVLMPLVPIPPLPVLFVLQIMVVQPSVASQEFTTLSLRPEYVVFHLFVDYDLLQYQQPCEPLHRPPAVREL